MSRNPVTYIVLKNIGPGRIVSNHQKILNIVTALDASKTSLRHLWNILMAFVQRIQPTSLKDFIQANNGDYSARSYQIKYEDQVYDITVEHKISDCGPYADTIKTILRLPNDGYIDMQIPNEPRIARETEVLRFLNELEKLIGFDWFKYIEMWYDSGTRRFEIRVVNPGLNRTFEISYDYEVPQNFGIINTTSGISDYLKEKNLEPRWNDE